MFLDKKKVGQSITHLQKWGSFNSTVHLIVHGHNACKWANCDIYTYSSLCKNICVSIDVQHTYVTPWSRQKK